MEVVRGDVLRKGSHLFYADAGVGAEFDPDGADAGGGRGGVRGGGGDGVFFYHGGGGAGGEGHFFAAGREGGVSGMFGTRSVVGRGGVLTRDRHVGRRIVRGIRRG